MNEIKIDYTEIESDKATITRCINTINSSLDNLNNINNIIPESWKSNAAEQYREAANSSLIKPISEIQDSLSKLEYDLEYAIYAYRLTEGTIKDDAGTINAPVNNNPLTPSQPTTQEGTPEITTNTINQGNAATTPNIIATETNEEVETPEIINEDTTIIEQEEDNSTINDDNISTIIKPSTNTSTDRTPQQPIKSSNNAAKGIATTIIGLGAAGAAGAVGYGLYKKKKRDEEDEEDEDIIEDNTPEENYISEENATKLNDISE